MRLHRFFIEESISGKIIKIFDENILHQMKNVFRLKVGDFVILFDGSGKDFECETLLLSKKEGNFEVKEIRDAYIPEKKVELYLSVIKKDNFELAARQAVEVGVSKIVPVISERSEKKNIDMERLSRIMKEASEQCGRGDVPKIVNIISFENIFDDGVEDFIVFDISGEKIKNIEIKNVKILVGPEGGWSENERKIFEDKKIKTVSLGETVLRAETAAVVASGVVMLS